MKLIVCLGNPEPEYAGTRHNIGFMAAKQIIQDFGLEKVGNKFKSKLYEGRVGDERVFLIMPQTYMNLSGEAVQLISSFYKIPPTEMLVIYDDFELPLESIRIRPKGSAGTHNGMKSIIMCLNTDNFPRLRLGIGPKPAGMETTGFVLGKFTKEEGGKLEKIIQDASKAAESWIRDGLATCMNQFNTTGTSDPESTPI